MQDSVVSKVLDPPDSWWSHMSLEKAFEAEAWLLYLQALVPHSFKQVWTSTVTLIMLMFMWSFIETLAQVQWNADRRGPAHVKTS